METNTLKILQIVKVLSWIVFIGLCITAGAVAVTFLISLFVNPAVAGDLYQKLDLSDLYSFGIGHYIAIGLLMILLTVLKAVIFYLVIRIFKNLDINKPFSFETAMLTRIISYVAFAAGLIAMAANGYTEWLIGQGVAMQKDWAGTEWLFLAGIIFVVAIIFTRGVELQSEHELTI
ncbi:MAG TPA: DUF2975 domain-containing protein [Bacteroidales bacterium]|jgi:hypothetical protein|nr:DUF2975 domain-containing protein [Bacteroidales bacterium]